MSTNKINGTKLLREDLVRLIAQDCGVSQEKIKKVIDSYEKVVRDALLEGYFVSVRGIGTLNNKPRPATTIKVNNLVDRNGNPITNMNLKKEHNIPRMTFTKVFYTEMAEKTNGNPF